VRPLDPRLLRYARGTRTFLAATIGLGAAVAVLAIAQAVLLADLLSRAFQGGAAPAGPLVLLGAVVLARAAVVWAQEAVAGRASAAVKSTLRRRLLDHAVRLGPRWLGGERSGALATLATRGVDALDAYFSRYLPRLVLAVIVPLAVVVQVFTADWLSALTIALTLPLIPVFMILIGLYTQARTDRQWRLLALLSGHFLDVVAGLPTLKVFGRARAQAAAVRRITGEYRRATMSTLRVAFLSSLTLELLATLSVALVAVSIGLRLVEGALDLRTALLVLILAPEAYLPLRQVGAEFHASAEGLTAAEHVFRVLEEPLPPPGVQPLPRAGAPCQGEPLCRGGALIQVESVTVRYPGRSGPALAGQSLTLAPGEVVALAGPSGSGKSTLVSVLLGFVRPDEGRVLVGGVDLADLDPEAWRQHVAWVPQRPYLFAGTIAENIRLGAPGASDEAVRRAARLAHAEQFIDALPAGFATRLGDSGDGLSAGQRQRTALARAFLRDAPVLVLDEPTSNLDGESEAAVLDAVRRVAVGRTVLLVAHRPALLQLADRVVLLNPEPDIRGKRGYGRRFNGRKPRMSGSGAAEAGAEAGAGARAGAGAGEGAGAGAE
jgi:thiol reductant ABC exporter CydD subunit